MIEPDVIEQRIRESIPDVQHVQIKDLTGTKDHYEATIVSSAFDDKTRVEQHQMVYRALDELMAGPVHALALKTYTPNKWQQAQQ